MATNGSPIKVEDKDAERLEKLEMALTSAKPPMGAQEGAGDVLRYAETLAESIATAGRYARDHGAYLDDISSSYARQLRADAQEYAKNMLAAERRKQAELERILGKAAE
jgi:hypothetical protein